MFPIIFAGAVVAASSARKQEEARASQARICCEPSSELFMLSSADGGTGSIYCSENDIGRRLTPQDRGVCPVPLDDIEQTESHFFRVLNSTSANPRIRKMRNDVRNLVQKHAEKNSRFIQYKTDCSAHTNIPYLFLGVDHSHPGQEKKSMELVSSPQQPYVERLFEDLDAFIEAADMTSAKILVVLEAAAPVVKRVHPITGETRGAWLAECISKYNNLNFIIGEKGLRESEPDLFVSADVKRGEEAPENIQSRRYIQRNDYLLRTATTEMQKDLNKVVFVLVIAGNAHPFFYRTQHGHLRLETYMGMRAQMRTSSTFASISRYSQALRTIDEATASGCVQRQHLMQNDILKTQTKRKESGPAAKASGANQRKRGR